MRRMLIGSAGVMILVIATAILIMRPVEPGGGESSGIPTRNDTARTATNQREPQSATLAIESPDPVEATVQRLDAGRAKIPGWVPRGGLSGRVITVRGEPVSGAIVRLTEQSGRVTEAFTLPDRAALASSTTDSRGDFDFTGVPADFALFLFVSLSDGQTIMRSDVCAPAGATFAAGDIVVPDAARLDGLVSDDRGEPIEGATVSAGNPMEMLAPLESLIDGAGSDPGRVLSSHTTADGTFTIHGLLPGNVRVLAHSPGRLVAQVDTTLEAGKPNFTAITLQPGRTIRGRVIDSEGRPVPAATVVAHPIGQELTAIRRVPSGPDGRFFVDDMPASRIEILAYADPMLKGQAAVEAETSDVLVQMSEARVPGLSLSIEDVDGRPTRDVELWIVPEQSLGGRPTVINAGEQIAMRKLGALGPASADGSSQVNFPPEGWGLWGRTPISASTVAWPASADTKAALRLQPAAPVRGTVLDAASGEPIAGAEVDILLAVPRVSVPDGLLWSGERGDFEGPVSPAEELIVWARAAGHLEGEIRVPPTQRGGLVIRLPASGYVRLVAAPGSSWAPDKPVILILRERAGGSLRAIQFTGQPVLLSGLPLGMHDLVTRSTEDDHTARSLATIEVSAKSIGDVIVPQSAADDADNR